MSDFFADRPGASGGGRGAGTQQAPPRPSGPRRPGPLALTIVVVAAVVVGFSLFAGIWTDRLWFRSIGYGSVFNTLLVTRVGLFVVFGLVMALVVGVNLWIAFRFRPLFRPASPEQANLERYREVITPIRKLLLLGVSVVFGVFAGISATGTWRTYLLWRNGEEFGSNDPFFGRDIGFYVFDVPWLHFLTDFMMTAVFIAIVMAVVVHYLYGGIRLQSGGDRFTGAAVAHVSALAGIFLLLKGVDYWLDRFDLTSQTGELVTGMTYTRDNAVLPGKTILMYVVVICAVLFFVNVWRRTWLLPGVGVALFVVSALLLGAVWPGLMQRFQVRPNEPDRESTYIGHNIQATRDAFDIADTETTTYQASTDLSSTELRQDAATTEGVRLVDPELVSETFEQLQQVRGYYSVPGDVLDVDRYDIDGQQRDVVVAARELNQDGLPDSQKTWSNLTTVYTHGYGVIGAFGNQRNAEGEPVDSDGAPVWAEEDIPPRGAISEVQPDGSYRAQIYFGEQSPSYSIVGKAPGGDDIELDIPQGTGDPEQSTTNTYDGADGVGVGNLFNKLLYAVKFGDANIVLSSRVNENSKILYDRHPRERVQKVAPWLTVDNDALPAVVDGRIVWLLDGYTVSDMYPQAEKRSLEEMTSDAINPRSTFATLPTDQINYMRNAVKATVDAYDGTVTLYEWDEDDPVLQTWSKAFPGVVQPRADIPEELLGHMRYPQDLYKVQRELLARYHVLEPSVFYEGSDEWVVPTNPVDENSTRKQPPYRLTIGREDADSPTFSLTSTFVPRNRQNLASFMSVGADASDEETYGKFEILRLPGGSQVPGPQQIANNFQTNSQVATALRPFIQGNANVEYGNLLTLPVGGGLLYVQPLYTVREGGGDGSYPLLRLVVVSFGSDVGIGETLSEALDDALEASGEEPVDPDAGETPEETPEEEPSEEPSDGGTSAPLPTEALELLQQADEKFAEADRALQDGDLTGYSRAVDEARDLVERALSSQG